MDQVTPHIVLTNANIHLFRLLSLSQSVDLSVIVVAEQSLLRGRQMAHGVQRMVGQLLGLSAVQCRFIDIETAVLLTQVVVRLSIRCPDRIAILSTKARQLLEMGLRRIRQPNITGDRGLVMLTPRILITLPIVVEQLLAIWTHCQMIHIERGIELWAMPLRIYGIDLHEACARELDVFRILHDIGLIKHMAVICKCQRILAGGVSSQSLGLTAFLINQIDIKLTLSVRGESELFTIRRPDRSCVLAGMCGQLTCLTTGGRHSEQISLIRERDGLPIGRKGAIAHPERGLLRKRCRRRKG